MVKRLQAFIGGKEMTLDAAIEYWTKKAKENEQKYGQLVMWLEELKVFREEDKLKRVKK